MAAPDATRRALMLGAAGAPLAAAAPAAAHPDADLLRLEQEHGALDRAANSYAADLGRLETEADAAVGPMPDVLRVTADDRAAWPHSAPWWTAYNADQLRALLPRLQRHVHDGSSEGVRWTLGRAREVVNASDAREAAHKARLAATRHPAVEQAYDTAVERLGAVKEQILAAPAQTVAGLKVKARLLRQRLGAPDDDADVEDRITWALLTDVLSLPESAS